MLEGIEQEKASFSERLKQLKKDIKPLENPHWEPFDKTEVKNRFRNGSEQEKINLIDKYLTWKMHGMGELFTILFSDESENVREKAAENFFIVNDNTQSCKVFFTDFSPKVRAAIAKQTWIALKFPRTAERLFYDKNQTVKNSIANNIAMIYKFPHKIKQMILEKKVVLEKEKRLFMRQSLSKRLLLIPSS